MRTIPEIEHDIALERIGWEYEQRRNPHGAAVQRAADRIDTLLDELVEAKAWEAANVPSE